MKPHEMRAAAKGKLAEANKIFSDIQAEGREPTADEEARHDALVAEAEGLMNKAAAQEAREKRMNDLASQLGAQPGQLPHNDPGNTRNGRHGYSVLKALRQSDPGAKHERLDGIELETHQELQKIHSRSSKGVLLPWDLPVDQQRSSAYARGQGMERRDLTTSTGAGAVYEVTSSSMIELLRNVMLLRALGVRVLANMNGNFSLPKQTGTGTAYWVTEGNAPTGSNQSIGSVDFSPSTVGAITTYSRAFLHQTSIDAEMFVREDLSMIMAIELDRAGMAGSGSGAEPTGILLDSNVTVVSLGTDGGAPTWAKLLELEQGADTNNALVANMNFVTTPKARGKMKQVTKVASSTFADFLWDRDNTVNGYRAWSTNQVPSNLTKGSGTALSAAIFGDFSQAIYALWGGLDILVDPYTGGGAGNVKIIELQDADFQLRQAKAFSVIKDMITS